MITIQDTQRAEQLKAVHETSSKLQSLIGRSLYDILNDIEADITSDPKLFTHSVNPDTSKLLQDLSPTGRQRMLHHLAELVGEVIAASQPKATLLPFKPPHISAVLKEVE